MSSHRFDLQQDFEGAPEAGPNMYVDVPLSVTVTVTVSVCMSLPVSVYVSVSLSVCMFRLDGNFKSFPKHLL